MVDEMREMLDCKTPEAQKKYEQFLKDPLAVINGMGSVPGPGGLGGYRSVRPTQGWERRQKRHEKRRQGAQRQSDAFLHRLKENFRKKAMTSGEILSQSEKAGGIQWIVPNFLAKGSLHLLSGAPGAAKTYTALDLSHHLTSGTEWFGQAVEQTGVLYVDEEMGAIAFGERMRQIGITGKHRLFGHCRHGFKVHDLDDIGRLSREAYVNKLGVVIFDSMVAVHDYAESENSEMRKIRENVRPLLEDGLAILFLHHNRKGSDASNAGSANSK